MISEEDKINVKLVTRSGKGLRFLWAKQCPDGLPEWGRCRFYSNPAFREYDWYVAIDDIPRVQPRKREILNCPQSNTILITSEPSSVTYYGRAFASQFAHLITSQEEWALPHSNAKRIQTGNVWFYEKSYDEIVQLPLPAKTALLSTVCSSKQQAHTMHALRYHFTQKLKTEISDMDIFGHGVRFVEKKSEALDPYQFHLVVENHIAPHHWTEKLADAFLACSVPIYCGCPNVLDYFPKDSLIRIDIQDFHGSLAIIRETLSRKGEYERRLQAVLEARRRVMYEYNLPAMLNSYISASKLLGGNTGDIIYSRRIMRMRDPRDLMGFALWRTGNFLKKFSVSAGDTQ